MYAMLAKCVLMTLRVELRLKTLYYLRAAVLGSYVCDALSMEPDAHVVELNTELGACHEVYKETMLPTHHAYVFDGLDVLMDTIMTEAVLHVTAINRYGIGGLDVGHRVCGEEPRQPRRLQRCTVRQP